MTHATILFDTFQYAKDLQKSGFTEAQIETQVKYAKVQVELIKEQADNINKLIDNDLVTKKDLQEAKQELELKIEKMSYKIIITLVSVLGGIIVASVTILGFLIRN